ncbi:MAG: hypothetical protein NC350_04125 [Corallococcus sp.]|nr:hypothetical protein [Corallococcus sp.]
MVDKKDWRLIANASNDYFKDMKFYKVKFPDYWKTSRENKTEFYQKILADAQDFVNKTGRGGNYLNDDDVRLFWHEHCAFCFEKFTTDDETECYRSEDGYYWVCEDCLEDFKDYYNFTVIDSPEK